MTSSIRLIAALVAAAGLATPVSGSNQTSDRRDDLANGFRNPPMESRMRMFWRVFGPAWDRGEIDYQLGLMRDAGIGGVMTSFFYPVALDDPKTNIHNQKLGSPEFLDTFGYAARKAHELGLRFSVFGGSGWPFGGPTVPLTDAAQRIRQVVVRPGREMFEHKMPDLYAGERIIAIFSGNRNIIPELGRDSTFPAGDLKVYIAGPTLMKVKRPALGGEGFVVDHYNRPAALRYLESVVAPMLGAAPGLLDTVFCDSLEVYNSNWTYDFPEQFRQRRGYDIVNRLPELFEAKSAAGPNLRFDFWRTLAELTEERFTRTTGEWARGHGTKLEMEAYGTPPNPLTAARYIDVPAGEQYEWEGFSMSRLAASGAHLAGKRIISAEAWTWLGIPNRLADSLRDMKLASDIHFLAGCNDLIGVDFPYSPRNVPPPGWQPYYGPTMNQNNPQWPYFHALVDYVNRCQWMLRQGKPVADIAIYLPVEDSFAHGPVDQMLLDFYLRDHFVTGKKTGEFGLATSMEHHSELIHTLLTHGFNYDGIDFWAMKRLAKVKDGKLICGDGEYSVVILPGVEGIEAKSLEKLSEFVRQGGTIIIAGDIPSRTYSQSTSSKEIPKVLSRYADPGDRKATARFEKGRVYYSSDSRRNLLDALSRLKLDLVTEPKQDDVGFVHRRLAKEDIYFFTNLSGLPKRFWADVAPNRTQEHIQQDKFLRAYQFDPRTGRIWQNSLGYIGHERPTELLIDLPPYGSVFAVLTQEKVLSAPEHINLLATAKPETIVPLNLTWHLTFDGPNAPKPRDISKLISWAGWPDAKYFSGRGTYLSSLEWKGVLPTRCRLRFESVHEAGEVWINGNNAGVVWLPPYELEIAPLLKRGSNTIEVTVGNLPVNRFLGQPDENLRPLRAVYGNRFPEPQEKQAMKEPAPSGLVGDVSLVFSLEPSLFGAGITSAASTTPH